MKTNFTAKNAKVLRTIANTEHKGMNAAIRTLKTVWESDRTDLADAIKAAKDDGLTIDDFSAEFILTNLAGTKWVNEGVILTNKKGQVVDYVRRANSAKLSKSNKAEKESK